MKIVTSSPLTGVVENVSFKYAAKTYDRIRQLVEGRVQQDVMAEASWMVGLFKQGVLGISKTSPGGRLTPAHEWASGMRQPSPVAGAGIQWAPRTSKYMAWKEKHFHHSRWFLNNNVALPSTLGSASNWISYFGPIKVSIRPLPRNAGRSGPSLGTLSSRVPYQAGRYTRFMSAEDSSFHIRTGIANVSVSAMDHITPGMLPALASGNMGSYARDGRSTGLMGLLPEAAAFRLGGRGKNYRHTIEPFLSFFLTRAVPNALFLRLEQGLKTHLDIKHRRV